MLNWVLDGNSEHLVEKQLLGKDREIIWCDILGLFSHTIPPWTINPNMMTLHQEKKVNRALDHFKKGNWMDPAEIRGIVHGENIKLENRHRLIAAHFLGEQYAPVSVPKNLVDFLKNKVKTQDA